MRRSTLVLTLAMGLAMTPALAMSGDPVIVGPGTISTDAVEFATTLSHDGRTLLFNRVADEGRMHIWHASRNGEAWSKPVTIAFADARYNDIDPFVSRSGDRLYFSSNRPAPGARSDAATAEYDIWYATRVGDGWSPPIHAGAAVNSDLAEVFVSEDRQGNLYFIRFGTGVGRDLAANLMSARREGDAFTKAAPLMIEPGEAGRLINPAISADGRTLVMAGEKRLWMSKRSRVGTWSRFVAVDAATVSAETSSFAPYLSNDGATLYFTLERPVPGTERGQRDIYLVPFHTAR